MKILDLLIPAASAHEKWFVTVPKNSYPVPDYYYTVNPITVVSALAIAALTAAGAWIDRRVERSALYKLWESRLLPFRDYAPGLLAKTTGVFLLWNASRGSLIDPNFPLPADEIGLALRAIEIFVAILLMLGLFTAQAAAALVVLCFTTLYIHPGLFPDQIEIVYFVGIAAFLFNFPRSRFSLDRRFGTGVASTPERRRKAYLAMRICLGITLIDLALSNKWLNPSAHLALMDAYSEFNPYVILQWLGFGWLSKELYVFLLSVNELIIGIYVAAGFLTRIMALMLIPMFIISTIFLPIGDLIGHLPIIGTFVVLFLFGDTYHKHMVTTLPVKRTTAAA